MKSKTQLLLTFFIAVILGYVLVRGMHDSSSCKSVQTQVERHNLFIQGAQNTTVLQTIKEKLGPAINKIIKSELGLYEQYDFNFFLPKEEERGITLYYMSDTVADAHQQIDGLIKKSVQKNPKMFVLKKVTLLPTAHLFGDQKDELVLMVQDPEHELSSLNQELRMVMEHTNKEYKKKNQVSLYDQVKSQKFTYVPHIGLGRIRLVSLKQHIKQADDADKILKNIFDQIIKTTESTAKKLLNSKNSSIEFKKLRIWDQGLRSYVGEYAL